MMVGSQRLMLTLGTDAQKTDNKLFRFEYIKVLDTSVYQVWMAAKTGEVLLRTFP